MSLNQKTIKLNIKSSSISKSGEGNDYEYPNISMAIQNNSNNNWSGLLIEAVVFDSNGKLICHSENNFNYKNIIPGEEGVFELMMYDSNLSSSIKNTIFDCNVHLKVSSFHEEVLDLGVLQIPKNSNDFIKIDSKNFNNDLKIYGGLSRKDYDGDVDLQTQILIENKSSLLFKKVELVGEVVDKNGKGLCDVGNAIEALPLSFSKINGFGSLKVKKVNSAAVPLSIKIIKILDVEFLEIDGLMIGNSEKSEQWGFPS
jgi:hypothetical protein